MKPLPGHLLGPSQHRLDIEQFRSIPFQLQDTPTSFDWIIFAVIRWIIQQMNRPIDDISKLHHARQKLCASSTTLRTIVHFDLYETRHGLLLLSDRVPLGFDCIDDEVTRFIRTTKGDVQCRTIFIHNPTRDILLLAPHIVITRSVVASRHPPRVKTRQSSRSLYNLYSSV